MCSKVYTECIKLYCYEAVCPDDLVFDKGRGGCVDPNTLFGCRQKLALENEAKNSFLCLGQSSEDSNLMKQYNNGVLASY